MQITLDLLLDRGEHKIIYFFNDSYQSSERNFRLDDYFKGIKILDPYDES